MNNVESNYNDRLNILFENQSTLEKINLFISSEKTVQEAINLYRIKSMDSKYKLFLYNGKKLDTKLTISESGIQNGSVISVVDTAKY